MEKHLPVINLTTAGQSPQVVRDGTRQRPASLLPDTTDESGQAPEHNRSNKRFKHGVVAATDAGPTETTDTGTAPIPSAPIWLYATEQDMAERRRAHNKNHWSWTQCRTLREMLGLDHDHDAHDSKSSTVPSRIEWLVVANYMVDFEFLLDQVPELVSVPRVIVFYGIAETSPTVWMEANRGPNGTSSVEFVQLRPSDPPGPSNPLPRSIPFGVHHSKLFLIGFSDHRLRVVVHTANIRYTDICLKAQAAYIQDFLLKSQHTTSTIPNNFENSLVSYIQSYGYNKLHTWGPAAAAATRPCTLAHCLRQYNFSLARVVLIPSTPGYHRLDEPESLGHWKLRQTVAKHAAVPSKTAGPGDKMTTTTMRRPIVCQFSSIGSLSEKYLHELEVSMDTELSRGGGNTRTPPGRRPLSFKLVYPTVDEVRCSIEGYSGGSTVPGSTKNVSKPFLRPLFHRWSSLSSSSQGVGNPLWKGQHIPHIKTYYQLAVTGDDDNHDDGSLAWFVVSSHNLSKAAWGEIQTSSTRYAGRRLFIRSWELGVFVSPSLMGTERLIPWSDGACHPSAGEAAAACTIPLPYRLHPDPYDRSRDQPWAVDGKYAQPDRFGRTVGV